MQYAELKEVDLREVLLNTKREFPFAHLFGGVKKDLDNLNQQAEKIMSLFCQVGTILKGRE